MARGFVELRAVGGLLVRDPGAGQGARQVPRQDPEGAPVPADDGSDPDRARRLLQQRYVSDGRAPRGDVRRRKRGLDRPADRRRAQKIRAVPSGGARCGNARGPADQAADGARAAAL